MDVIEKLNMTVNEEGNVVKAEVNGSLMMNTQLSGMPFLKLGLNDQKLFEMKGKSTLNTVEFEAVKFHQCVNLRKFDDDRVITFTPPDGEFELMTYRLEADVYPKNLNLAETPFLRKCDS